MNTHSRSAIKSIGNIIIFTVMAGLFGTAMFWKAQYTQDFTNITIPHPDGTTTILQCRSGSGVIACMHSDLFLSVQ